MNNLEVIHNTEAKRVEIGLGDALALVEYMHFGSNTAHAALEYAKAEGLRVNPVCPFIKLLIRRHPEYQPITLGC